MIADDLRNRRPAEIELASQALGDEAFARVLAAFERG
jgi:hypothetical protein